MVALFPDISPFFVQLKEPETAKTPSNTVRNIFLKN
jgi:hypothetical protein